MKKTKKIWILALFFISNFSLCSSLNISLKEKRLNENVRKFLKKITPLHRLSYALEKDIRTNKPSEQMHCTNEKNIPLLKELKEKMIRYDVKALCNGEGASGKAYTVSSSSGEYVIKKMKHSLTPEKLAMEIVPHLVLGKHPNIIKYFGCFQDYFGHWFIVLEKAQYDLYTYITEVKLTPAHLLKIKKDLVAAVNYLHGKGFSHSDLKLENCVVFVSPTTDEIQVKLIDFGNMRSDRQKESTDSFTPDYNSSLELKFYSMLWEKYKYKKKEDFLNLTEKKFKEETTRALLKLVKQLGFTRKPFHQIPEMIRPYKDDNELNTLINKMRAMLKAINPEFAKKKYLNAWILSQKNPSKRQFWQEIIYQYIRHYERKMADIYALNIIFYHLDGQVGKIERTNPRLSTNPFSRPKIQEIKKTLDEMV